MRMTLGGLSGPPLVFMGQRARGLSMPLLEPPCREVEGPLQSVLEPLLEPPKKVPLSPLGPRPLRALGPRLALWGPPARLGRP